MESDMELFETMSSGNADLLSLFFALLWRKPSTSNSAAAAAAAVEAGRDGRRSGVAGNDGLLDLRFHLPDTVILHHSRVLHWFFTAKDGTIKKKSRKNLGVKPLISTLVAKGHKNSRSGIIAALTSPDPTMEEGFCQRFASNFAELQGLVTENSSGILQQFVEPKVERTGTGLTNQVIVAQWTPNVFFIERRVNSCRMDSDRVPVNDRCTTADTSSYVRISPLVSTLTTRVLEQQCIAAASHIESVFHYRCVSLNLHFVIDANDVPWILRCTNLRIMNPRDIKRSVVLSLGGGPQFMAAQKEEEQREIDEKATMLAAKAKALGLITGSSTINNHHQDNVNAGEGGGTRVIHKTSFYTGVERDPLEHSTKRSARGSALFGDLDSSARDGYPPAGGGGDSINPSSASEVRKQQSLRRKRSIVIPALLMSRHTSLASQMTDDDDEEEEDFEDDENDGHSGSDNRSNSGRRMSREGTGDSHPFGGFLGSGNVNSNSGSMADPIRTAVRSTRTKSMVGFASEMMESMYDGAEESTGTRSEHGEEQIEEDGGRPQCSLCKIILDPSYGARGGRDGNKMVVPNRKSRRGSSTIKNSTIGSDSASDNTSTPPKRGGVGPRHSTTTTASRTTKNNNNLRQTDPSLYWRAFTTVPLKHVLFPLSVLSFYATHAASASFSSYWSPYDDDVPDFVRLIFPDMLTADYDCLREDDLWNGQPIPLCDACSSGLCSLTAAINVSKDGSIRYPFGAGKTAPQVKGLMVALQRGIPRELPSEKEHKALQHISPARKRSLAAAAAAQAPPKKERRPSLSSYNQQSKTPEPKRAKTSNSDKEANIPPTSLTPQPRRSTTGGVGIPSSSEKDITKTSKKRLGRPGGTSSSPSLTPLFSTHLEPVLPVSQRDLSPYKLKRGELKKRMSLPAIDEHRRHQRQNGMNI